MTLFAAAGAAAGAPGGGLGGGLSTRAHVLVIAITLLTIGFIVRLVRTRQLRAKYSVLWLSIGGALLVLAAIPGLLTDLADSAGIYYPPAMFLLLAVVLLFVLAVHSSWELSRLEDRTRTLAEQVSLLREELDASIRDRGEAADREPIPAELR